jgi:hypothetical protein
MGRLDRDYDVWPDNWQERLVLIVTVGVFILLLYLWFTSPSSLFRAVASLLQSEGVIDTGGGLTIASEDVEYLNRIYRETPNEVAYCGLIIDGNRLQPWLAEQLDGSKRHVEFSTEDCPTDVGDLEATIHTHPAGSTGDLSQRDRAVFLERRWAYMCIHHGPIRNEVGGETSNFRCYEKVTAGQTADIREASVTVVTG